MIRFKTQSLRFVFEEIFGRSLRMQNNIILECVETGERLYLTSKNQRNTPYRLELKKYSPKLRRKAIFREIKK